ncbi:MAG: triose-phosphate isomerase [Aquabacterium sp.]
MSAMKKLVVGNWKMHGSRASNAELIQGLLAADLAATAPNADVAVCPPFVFLADVAEALKGSAIAFGSQDVSVQAQGAYTGEVAAPMVREFGAKYAIVGHSERRSYHAESDQLVADKAKAALAHGLVPIVCVGETLDEREADQTEAVVSRQMTAVIDTLGADLSKIVVAYEPVWAIGTGKTASPEQAQAVHAMLRAQLKAAQAAAASVPLLYGGSVKPDNARELFAQADIDGGLIGGASLKAADFAAIARAA